MRERMAEVTKDLSVMNEGWGLEQKESSFSTMVAGKKR